MNFKELTAANYVDYITLYNKIKPEQTLDYSGPTISALQNYYFDDTETLYKVFGAFDTHGILHSCVFAVFSKYDRAWSIRYVVKADFATMVTLLETIDYAISVAEKANYYRFYAVYFGNNAKIWEKLVIRKIKRSTNYQMQTEEIIPENKKSSFEKYWIFFQSTIIYSRSITIREYSLKEEFRTFAFGPCNRFINI